MTPGARERIYRALKALESAQLALGRASEAVSPVVGLVSEWERIGELYAKVNAEWHRLNGLDGPFRLDSEARP